MPAISTLIAAAGLAASAAGGITSYEASKDNASIQQQQQQANIDHANAVNASQVKVLADNADATQQEQNVNTVNQQQMNLDALRKQRSIIRSSVVANSQALSAETNAGAAGPGGSTIGGISGNISGQTGVNLLGVTQNQEAGNAIFGYHAQQLADYKQAAIDGYVPATAQFPNTTGTEAAVGAGLSSLGGAVVKSEGLIGKVGTYFGGSSGPTGSFSNGGNDGAAPTWSS